MLLHHILIVPIVIQRFKSDYKGNIHGDKVLLFIWWDQQSAVYYELLS